MALKSRAYTKRQIDNAREDLDYECRAALTQKRIAEAAQKNIRGQKCPGMPIVVPHKPEVQEWWQNSKGQDLVLLEGLKNENSALS